MAKDKTEAPSPPPLWSADDLPRLAASLDEMESRLSTANTLLVATVERVDRAEATLNLLDPEKVTLPVELTRTLNLGNIYCSAINGMLMSGFLSSPTLATDSKYRRQRLNQVVDFADELIAVICERHCVKGKVKVES